MRNRDIANVSIKTKYFRIIFILFIAFLISGIALFFYINNQQDKLKSDRVVLQHKTETINELAATLNEVFFRARGYVALKSDNELALLNTALTTLDGILEQYSGLNLSPEEAEYRDDLDAFYSEYKNETLPEVIQLVSQDDYTAIRNLSQSGSTKAVNEFLGYTKAFKTRSDNQLNDMASQSIKQADTFTFFAFGLSAVLLLFFTLMIWRMLKVVLDPIVKLEEATNSLAAGEAVLLGKLHKQDEIGRLYEAFLNMARSIQDKEEELMMQNEELHAQQDELQDQQFKLERSLSEIESMMKALNQSSAVGILTSKGVFSYANDNLSSYTGYRNSEIIGYTFRLFELHNMLDAQVEQIIRKLSTGGVWTGEVQIESKGGSIVWLQITIMPYLNDEGQIYQYILIANNITSMKNIQQELAETLKSTEQTSMMLELNNQLNHEITYTLDKQEFAEKFSQFMNRLYSFDSSLFLLVKDKISVVKGVPHENVERYINENSKDMLYRLSQEKSYIVKRKGVPREQGIAAKDVYCYDFYTTVVNAEDEILAIFCGTRIGHSFTEEETSEIKGMMNRVALAIERLFMYEEIEHGRKLNRDIVNNVNEGIQFVDTEGVIQHINKALSELFGYEDWAEGKLVAKELWMNHFILRVNEPEEMRQFYQKAMSPHTVDSSTMKYSLGKEAMKHVDVYAIPVFRRETRVGTLFVHRDITREYELDLMKSELVSTVSHELRTPLSSVLGFTELLLSKTMKPEKQLKYLETIHKEAKRLTELINDFLDLQRMESGTQLYSAEKINLSETVLSVIDQYKLSGTHHILLEDEALNAEVEVDKDKIIQVLTNMLSNAIKFSPGSNEIKVMLHNEPGKVVVRIQDHGLGIPKNQIGQLFQKFRRVDNSASKRIGGTGLGLAICKEIIEKQKGSIGIESVEGEGSTVWFSLPVLHDEGSGHEDDPHKWSAGKENKPNVMIVEDDYSLSLLLSEELKNKGFRVTHHYHPQKAFDQAVKTPFVAIVVDLMLGEELDGWDLIRMLKNDPRTENVPIVISSALDKGDKSMLDNVQKYLTKPYPPGELSNTLQDIVQIKLKSGEVLFPDSWGAQL
ncbi:ATP-binding protein [Paenibacillus sp. MMS20-IR301]|uniref:ATP-binding protein n=1 Tax=Paenibacillus sp. MMS20-IR301 TaxID=2895946 RepID=UPI0028E68C81|nr:ATP-binding protein [Paenibacillus sp. MMS20-IR301]WNS44603.1 ATP-binding protein [Paenibacillus sp. MMS20-IR301]